MKKIRRKGKAEGSVLFTVVTVMMVMVVFLMSTLVLTTSANRRSYYTFYENQAQYTAQGVLDAILNAANDPNDNTGEVENFYRWITNLAPGDVGNIQVDLTGSQIPLTRHADPNNSAVTATVERITDNYIWDADSSSVCKQSGWKITVTASVGQGRNASEYTMASYIYENPLVTVPTGVFNNASWNVMDSLQVTDGHSTTNPSTSLANKAKAIMVASVANANSGNNLLCLGPQSYGLAMVPRGRGKYEGAPVSQFMNNSETVGDGIFVGNFQTNNAVSFIAQRPGEGVQFWGNIYAQNMFEYRSEINDYDGVTEYRQVPYLYVDGNLHFNGQTGQEVGMQLGQPVNVYVGSMTNIPQNMNGDIYMFDPAATSALENDRKTVLSTFITRNIQKTNYNGRGYVGGDIISNNSVMSIAGAVSEIGGDVIMTNPNGKLTIRLQNEDLTIKGALLCAGDLEIVTGNKSLTVLGGIYSTSSRTSISGTVNGVANGSLSAICDATNGLPAYDTAEIEPGQNTYKFIQNTAASAHFESLGGRGAEDSDYDALVTKLLSGKLGAQDGDTYYTEANNSGLDFSMFPFCSRQDEIFTHYFRWDLAADDQNTAAANCDNDPLCQESKACGHKWAVTAKASREGTKWVPYTVPKSASANYQTLDPDIIMPIGKNCFIPMLETYDGSPLAANLYYNDVNDFKSGITDSETFGSLPKKDISFISHKADGTAVTTKLENTPIITKSCELDLANNNAAYNLFIDPSQSTEKLRIVLKGSFMNAALTIIVNNSCYYPVGPSGAEYDSPQTYADYSHTNRNPIFAGRDDVQIFLDQSIFATKDFVITTTGAYQQLKDQVYDVVSNPIYPGEVNGNGDVVLNSAWEALYPGKDAFKFELVPNIVIYGQKGVDYATTNYNQPAFPNGFVANAEIIMPDSGFSSKAGENNAKSIAYREFTDSIPYDPNANTVNVANSKRIISLGTILVGESDSNNVSNLPICVYLGDLNRNGGSSTSPSVNAGSASKNNNGSATSASKKDRFAKDHQGAR